VVEHLLSKYEALSSNSSTAKKKKKDFRAKRKLHEETELKDVVTKAPWLVIC
jgi:primosomal protein N''